MLRMITWRAWGVIGVLLAGYAGLGYWLSGNGTVEYDMYKYGLTMLTFAPLIFMGVYTVTGNKWWRNDVGSALGVLSFGLTWTAWPLAYTFWFLNGVLHTSWLGWIEVSGPAVIALAVLRLSYVFLRYHRDGSEAVND